MDNQKELTTQVNNVRSVETPLGNIEIDYDLLGSELEGSDLSEDEKKEFIDCICWIMLSFVDLGYGIESTQQAMLAGQSNIDSGSPPTLPFVDLIMGNELADEFKSSTDSNPSTSNKEIISKGANT